MTKELVISHNRHESKVAVLEDDQLVEVYFQRANEYSLAGSIHKGRVTRVLPGMQSAFVDLGLERDTFLYVSDFFEESGEEFDRTPVPEERPRQQRQEEAPRVQPAEAAAAAPAAGPAPQPRPEIDSRDRRGKRSRRRRTRGFPEDKYASEPAPVVAETRETIKPAKPEEIFVLPGESLAKYRHQPESEETAAGPEETPVVEEETAAEVEPAAAEVETIRKMADIAEARAEAIEEAVEHALAQQAAEAAEAAEEDEEQELPSPGDDIEGAEAEEFVGEAEGRTVSEEAAAVEPASGPTGAEPARIPQSLTAQLRERDMGSRFQQQRGGPRRMRRRGRGGPDQQGQDRDQQRAVADRETEKEKEPEKTATASISDLLKEGQEILVQIAKEPMGQKGARITSHIALPGRYCVYMPTVDHVGVSRRIASDEERQRLKRILQTHRQGMSGGFIIRTAGEGKAEDDIAADMSFLYNLWLDIRGRAERRPAPAMVHHDLDIVHRTLRDQLTDNFKAIWVDDEEMYTGVLSFVQRFQPALVPRVKLYTREAPIFDAFGITQELEKALRPKMWLKSGGYIVINQTEALVAIDVNTGKFVGKSNRLEDTIVKTNTEAVKEIVRQIRLRDLGGIIVVDFIDMDERKNRQKVMQALEDAMRADRAPYKILQFNDFGLVAITRKRVKQSLERTLCALCPYCEGAGYVKSVQTVIGEIIAEARKISKALEGKEALLRVHPEVAKVLKSTGNRYLEELEGILGRPVLVKKDEAIHIEKFDLT